MSFWDHLEALRWTLFRCILALFVFTIASFSVMRYLFDHVIMAPCYGDFATYQLMCKVTSSVSFLPDFCDSAFKVNIVNIKLATQFFTHMSSSFWLALLLTFPYLVYEVWKFIRPALYENEMKSVRWVQTQCTRHLQYLSCLFYLHIPPEAFVPKSQNNFLTLY